MENRNYCVYCHTDPNGRRYVGITSRKPEKRWKCGNGYRENEYFFRAIRKYGWDSFTHEILEEGLTAEEASEEEIRLIKEFRSFEREYGFNLELGGLTGNKHLSEETKQKIGDSHRGRYTEAQWEATRNRRPTQYHHTEEAKRAIGDSHRGKPLTDEHKKKLSESHKGIRPSDENLNTLKKVRMRKVVKCDMEGNEICVYDSLKVAAEENDTLYQCISACCRGKAAYSGAYKWKYADAGDV